MRSVIKNIFKYDAARMAFFLAVLLTVGLVFVLTPNLFPSAIISILIFFIFSPLIDSAERKGISRAMAILFIFSVCGLGLTVLSMKLTPKISSEIDLLSADTNGIFSSKVIEKFKAQEAAIAESVPMFKDFMLTEKAVKYFQSSSEKFWTSATDFFSHLLVCLLLAPFLAFILLKDIHEIKRSMLSLVPNRHFETMYGLFHRIQEDMGGYVAARILEAALVMSMVTIGCLWLNIPYAFVIGFFAGATNPIPYLGPLLGAVPAVVLAVVKPEIPNHLFWISMVFLIANVIDTILIFPVMVAKIVDLHPVVVVISVMVGAQLFGITGMIMAVPVTSILKILISEIYSRIYNQNEGLR